MLNENTMLNVCVNILLSMLLLIVFVNSFFGRNVQKRRAGRCFTLWIFFRILNQVIDSFIWAFKDFNIPVFCANGLFGLYIYSLSAIFIFMSGWAMYLIKEKNEIPKAVSAVESFAPLVMLPLVLGFCFFSGKSYYDVFLGQQFDIYIFLIKVFETLYLIYTLAVIIKYRQTLKWYETMLFTGLLVPVALIWQRVWIHIPSAIFGTMAILLVYIEVWIRRRKELYRKEQKISELNTLLSRSRMDVMISQIQPHFLYNSLSAIAGLCETNPEKAHDMTVSFKEYLRVNLMALKESEPIEFSDELKHIRAYLDIEKARFEERLNIVYNIEDTDFKVPILSIQVLVENAVKHGVCKKVKGGTVEISTERKDKGRIIKIKDDGVGFDTNLINSDGGIHIGIENARERLALQCNGTLQITSKIGEGTIATVFIP